MPRALIFGLFSRYLTLVLQNPFAPFHRSLPITCVNPGSSEQLSQLPVGVSDPTGGAFIPNGCAPFVEYQVQTGGGDILSIDIHTCAVTVADIHFGQ